MRPSVNPEQSAATGRQTDLRLDLVALTLLAVFVSLIYGARLTVQPLVGEETRWATGAREMLASGDWVVPCQQGQVFAERPPMSMWMMAAAGWLRGDVDPIAVRLPSVVAVVLTSLLIYAYTRSFASRSAALIAALAYSTMGQVLQIGRLGESEALFTLLVSASLLLWHVSYIRGWRPLFVWTIGFAFAGLAALVKGPQAPVYFVAITAAYLIVRGDWRYLISWQCFAGAVVFVSIVAAWQIPFYFATDWPTVVATWSGLAADRIHLRGVLAHAVEYPVETFVCLLPWSPILVALMVRDTRKLLRDVQPTLTYLAIAIGVAYPTVWLAAGARGRYFMPLYPIVSILVGLLIDRCSTATLGSYPRRAWRQFVSLWATVVTGGAILILGANLIYSDPAKRFYQPRSFAVAFAALAMVAAAVLWLSFRRRATAPPVRAVFAIALVTAIGSAGIMLNVNVARWTNPSDDVAKLKDLLPRNPTLVSLSPIEHRFAYYYREAIAELAWPTNIDDVSQDIEYFCFMRQPGDTAKSRAAGRGRSWYKTPGTLPFEWEELASICVERQGYELAPRTVVLGRIVRPIKPAITDATVPQPRRLETAQNLKSRK
jgi:4-amino-4-deoxy-L-arabinose transferase-like glycosyltransferase